MSLSTNLGRVRSILGAKECVAHWWAQRLTAIILIPLILWLVINIILLAGADLREVQAWVGDPITSVLLTVMFIAMFYHMQLGLQVVIEDYVYSERLKVAFIFSVKSMAMFLAAISLFAILKIVLIG